MTTQTRQALMLLAAAALVYLVATGAAHALIEAVYNGSVFPGLLENRQTKTLDYYYGVVDRLVLAGIFLIGIIGATIFASRSSSSLVVLALLLLGDIVFCALSESYGGLLDVRLDGGLPEWFQYFKEATVTFLFLRLFWDTKKHIFVGWACLFGFILLDDALKYHEHAGVLLGTLPGMDAVARALEIRPADIGEMLSLVPVLVALALFLPLPYLRERAEIRSVVHRLVGLLGGLIAFGGVMDLVDRVAVTLGSSLTPVLSLAEDGGEMIIMSATFAYVLTVWRRYGTSALGGQRQTLIHENRLADIRQAN